MVCLFYPIAYLSFIKCVKCSVLIAHFTSSLSGTYFNCIMFMVASSVVSTILILNYHHRNADTHEMSDWVSIGCTPYLYVESLVPHSAYMLCTGQKGRWKCKIGMPQIIRGKSHSKWSGIPCIVGMTPSTFNGACFPIPVERSAMARRASFSAPAKGSTRHGLMRNVVWVLRVLNLQWGPLRISLRVQFANASSGWAAGGVLFKPLCDIPSPFGVHCWADRIRKHLTAWWILCKPYSPVYGNMWIDTLPPPETGRHNL